LLRRVRIEVSASSCIDQIVLSVVQQKAVGRLASARLKGTEPNSTPVEGWRP
jgi:hypothetical protein